MPGKPAKTPRRLKKAEVAAAPAPPPSAPPTTPAKAEEPAKAVDVLEELTILYRLQIERIQIDHVIEQKLGKALTNLTSDIRVASDVLWRIAALRAAGRLGLRATLKRVARALLE